METNIVSNAEELSADSAPARASPKSHPVRLTRDEMDFISFSIDEHLGLIDNHHGCLWEKNKKEEKKKGYRVVHAIKDASVDEKIEPEDFWFLQFVLSETADFGVEGVCQTWCKNPACSATKAQKLIHKLAILAGISKEQVAEGMPQVLL